MYELKPVTYEYRGYKIDLRNPRQGLFGVIEGGMRLSKKTLEFDYEPLPSSRTDEWIAEHCFTLDEAKDAIDRLEGDYDTAQP
jgi:hypothetical protein